jgi:hypothetical protein
VNLQSRDFQLINVENAFRVPISVES